MAKHTCYRVQPVGQELGQHRSETSNGELDRGVHVFGCLSALGGGVRGWCNPGWQPEVVAIECDLADLRDNGDYEGFVLVGNRGIIVERITFPTWEALLDWAKTVE